MKYLTNLNAAYYDNMDCNDSRSSTAAVTLAHQRDSTATASGSATGSACHWQWLPYENFLDATIEND